MLTTQELPPGHREEITNGGGITESIRTNVHVIDDATYWSTWSMRHGDITIRTWVELARCTPDGWKFWAEGPKLTRYDCPLAFFGIAKAANLEFRDRCWAWHEAQLEATLAKGA